MPWRPQDLSRRLELEITEFNFCSTIAKEQSRSYSNFTRPAYAWHSTILVPATSSSSYLSLFPFDKIKFDRCVLIKALSRRGSDLNSIVWSVARLGSSLGIETTAEGIETANSSKSCAAKDCTSAQGYHFYPPMPADRKQHGPLQFPPTTSSSRKGSLLEMPNGVEKFLGTCQLAQRRRHASERSISTT